MSEENPPGNLHEQTIEELARRLATAFISIQMDVSIAHAYRKYKPEGRPGQYWVDLAEKVLEEMTGKSAMKLRIKTDKNGRWLETD